MKQTLKMFLVLSAILFSVNAVAGFINTLDLNIKNESEYTVSNIKSAKNSKGSLLGIYADNIAINATAEVADFRTNFLGQLSQNLGLDLYDNNGLNAGSCNLHIGLGSYLAKPDFSGSICVLSDGGYVQVNPTYEIIDNTYHTRYKLTSVKSFSRIIMFGDSMSDNGNLYKRSVELSLIFPISPILPVSPPYYKGRFTNGNVWVELLSQKLNIPEGSLLNYAYAGARVNKDYMPIPNLDKQVNKYLTWNKSGDPYALYVVWIGSNDLLRGLNKTSDDALLHSILDGNEYNLRRLINHGAMHILSPVLPDLSLTPDSIAIDNRNGHSEYTQRMKSLIIKYNVLHKQMLEKLKEENPEVNIMSFDVFQFINDARDKASDFGFSVINEPCNPNSYWKDELAVCSVPKEYVFWDGVHPSAKAHQILSDLMLKVVLDGGYKPNVKKLRAAAPDEVSIRNHKAIEELQKEIDMGTKGYAQGIQGLRDVVDKNIPLF